MVFFSSEASEDDHCRAVQDHPAEAKTGGGRDPFSRAGHEEEAAPSNPLRRTLSGQDPVFFEAPGDSNFQPRFEPLLYRYCVSYFSSLSFIARIS